VVLNPEGTVTYTPVDAFVGTDHFTYEVSDGHGGSARASVTISVRTLPKLTLQIISPQEGQRLSFPKIEVRELVIMPAGVPHELRADAPFKMLLIMIREQSA